MFKSIKALWPAKRAPLPQDKLPWYPVKPKLKPQTKKRAEQENNKFMEEQG